MNLDLINTWLAGAVTMLMKVYRCKVTKGFIFSFLHRGIAHLQLLQPRQCILLPSYMNRHWSLRMDCRHIWPDLRQPTIILHMSI